MPDDLEQLARGRDDLQSLADQQQMSHQAQQPNPARPYLDAVRSFGQGVQRFSQGGLTGAFPQLRQYMPGFANTLGNLVQSRAAQDAFSSANVGGLPLIEAMWTPRDLGILKTIYSANIDPYTLSGLIRKYLPGRSPVSIRQKAMLLGLRRPEIPPYVRQPGSPSVANDPQRSAQISELLKKGMSSAEISSRMGDVSARTIRRYINENLNRPRMAGRGGSALPPSMPSFKFQDEVVTGDPEYEKALMQYLQQRYPQ